ncbi:efflux RND transporter periplasmic adaptor subunit [Vineibacter terrae]|uniref:efflux RND transporter periplasmic adaptor subunit n=1 Tax=Vineibacter terrae TaxID=2586908 RepID=UPI002E3441BC|nr:efflux RND transporter periplasmic adaptor subunit [Vineibacter terrae]HEX2892249.1 efflux RND transporter periplasmic adaptor subunit [Vineibacter terrae]
MARSVLGGVYLLLALAMDGTAAAQAPPPAPPAVTVAAPLQREVVEYDEFTGQFAAVEFVELRARVSGYLQSHHFEEGQIVKKGDLLFVIDPRPFEAALASAKAQLGQAQARVELADRQLARAAELRGRDFVAASTYDERLQEQRVATAAVEIAKAAVRTAELDVEFARILAPVSGRIGRREVSDGNLVSGGSGAGNTLLTTIVSLDPIYFVFDMSEGDFIAYQRAVQSGRLQSTRDAITVFARLRDEPDWPREGKLNFVDNQVNRSAGTIRARAVFPNPDGFLTPGQFGRIRLPGSEPYKALLIPDAAILTDQSQKIVMTVNAEGVVSPKMVRPGPIYDGLRIIRSGLAPEDRVIINGLVRARPGAKVTPQPGEIKGAGERRPG